jgi:hypothetical protein
LDVAGHIVSQRSPTGDILAIALPVQALEWKPAFHMSSPRLEFAMPQCVSSALQHNTLDLMLILHRQDFEPSDDPPRFWSPATRNAYRLRSVLSGSKLYFVCLVLRDEIMNRGAEQILHNGSAKYYRLLLNLENLVALRGCAEADLPACLLDDLDKDKALHKPLCDTSHHNDGDDCDDHESPNDPDIDTVYDHGALALLPVQLAAHAAEQSTLVSYHCPVSNSYVHFDNCSHSSGLLRSYILCSTHANCSKHAQVQTQGTRERAIAYCLAWNEWGKTLGRDQHSGRDKAPPDDIVQEMLLRIQS